LTIAIIDYGSGNLRSAQKAFERVASELSLKSEVMLTAYAEDVAAADHIVLPGVGAFADCEAGLDALDGMTEALRERVLIGGKPFLGICVGMQLLATTGYEREVTNGLDWLPGRVQKLEVDSTAYKIPHMGWNTIDVLKSHKVLEGLDGESVYFVHSYAFRPDDIINCLATTTHGASFASVVGHNNVIGTQFHPEKSQHVGLRLIKNFLEWRP
jgi:glutamine amidotransferase